LYLLLDVKFTSSPASLKHKWAVMEIPVTKRFQQVLK
jgi:hypothetical protein